MKKIYIGEQEYDFQITYGKHLKMISKYPDGYDAVNWTINKYNEYIFDVIWLSLKRKLFFKPFLTKNRMKNSMTLRELRWFQLNIGKILSGDDDFLSVEEFQNKEKKKVEKKRVKKQK